MADFINYDELMPKIQALIDPADTFRQDLSVTDQHPFFKRKGKWHNHDNCDACGEKGKLLCCDICPASFHLLCHDPPLDVIRVPNGPWTCSACNNIRDTKKNSSKKSYKIEFVDCRKTTNLQSNERRNASSIPKNMQKKFKEILLPLSQSKYSIPPVGTDIASRNINCQPNICDTDLPLGDSNKAKIQKLHQKLSDLSFGSNPDYQFNLSTNVGLPSEIDSRTDKTTCDAELTIESKIQEWNVDPCSNINCGNAIIKEQLPDFNHRKRSGYPCLSVNLPKCDLLVKEPSISCMTSENQLPLTNEKSTVKENGICRTCDRNNIYGIENIFNIIINETKKLNPRQFVLPDEYISEINENILKPEKDWDTIPNDWDSNDLLKIPSRKCFFCRGNCFTGQMISCDYCPAHFHLNCLNIPLCSLPDIKWMCPLHPHHILEKVMHNPDSITELTAWWKDLSSSVDSNDVISKFVDKTRRIKKTTLPPVNTAIKIPDIVKYHYKHPLPHVPDSKELTDQKSDCVFKEDFTLLPHELIMISNNCCKRSERRETPVSRNYTMDGVKNNKLASVSMMPIETPVLDPKSCIEIISDDKLDAFHSNFVKKAYKSNENLSTWDPTSRCFRFKSYGIYDFQSIPALPKKNPTANEQSPWEKIEGILDRNIHTKYISNGTNATKLESNLKRLLMNEEVNSIVKDLPPSFLPNTSPYPFTPRFWNENSTAQKLSSKIHAVLCPLSHRAPPIYMCDGSLSLGLDFSNDGCLLNYGYCNFISDEHAVIFYDKLSKTYELLNYSEFSTVVDGVTYTCDISSPDFANNVTNATPVDNANLNDEKLPVERSAICQEKAEKCKKSEVEEAPPASRSRIKSVGFESRNLYKKLMSDIDKLIIKTKKEMASIAEDDLNEIAKAMKASSDANRVAKESSAEKQKMKKKPELMVEVKELEGETLEYLIDSLTQTSSKQNPTNDKEAFVCPNDESENVNDGVMQPSELSSLDEDVIVLPPPSKSEKNDSHSVDVSKKVEKKSLRGSGRKRKRCTDAICRPEVKKNDELPLDATGKDDVQHLKTKFPSNVTRGNESVREEFCKLNDLVPETKEKCRCQLNNLLLPYGNDSSWENSALLRHGSHLRFGCVEFVFSIVNNSTVNHSTAHNSSTNLKRQLAHQPLSKSTGFAPKIPDHHKEPPAKRRKESKDDDLKGQKKYEEDDLERPKESKEDDLSVKLRSLLNVLSSKKSSSLSSNSSAGNSSARSSPSWSRSPTPPPTTSAASDELLDSAGLVEINYEAIERRTKTEIRTEHLSGQ